MLARDRRNGIVIGRQAEQIDRDDDARLEPTPLRGCYGTLQAFWVDVEGVSLHVGQYRRRAKERHHFGCRVERKGRADHRVARPDLPGHEDEQKRIGSARTGDDMAGAAERREIDFERPDLRPLDELAVRKHASNRIVDAAAQAAALCGNVDERNRTAFKPRVLIHYLAQTESAAVQPATRRGPLRCGAAVRAARASRQRIAISRLATASSPVTAGRSPLRTASTKAMSSERNGSA